MLLRKLTQTPAIPVIPEEIVTILKDVSKQFYRSPEKQKECLQTLLQSYVEHAPTIRHLTENPDKIPQLLDSFTQMLKEIIPQLPSKFKKQATGLAVLSFLGTSAAQSNNLNVITGQVGGNNLCSGFLNCIQGAIVNVTDNTVVASYNAFLNLAGKINLGAVWAFNSCMDPSNIGNALKDILVQNSESAIGTITSPCAANYNPGTSMSGGNIGSQVLDLNVEQCLAYQNSFMAEAQRCMPDGRIIGLNWAIGVICAAVVLAVVIPIICCCYCKSSCKNG